jgi:hypothetical protein
MTLRATTPELSDNASCRGAGRKSRARIEQKKGDMENSSDPESLEMLTIRKLPYGYEPIGA